MVTSDAANQWPLCQEANSAKKCGSAGFDRIVGGTVRTTAQPQRMNNPRAKVQTNQQRKTTGTTQQQVTDKAPTQQPTSKNQHQPPINNRHRKINHNEEARAYNQQCTPKLRPPQQRNKRWRPCSQAHLSQCSRGSRDMVTSDGHF